ncbi:MAG: hypothetical protein FD135_767 [Comamonadaceae bacterium]|nr:MAG: hypothetical protein FD135_767 [Comamonadaceae bacterium]
MDISGIWKYLAAWFLMLLVSIANGAARDLTYGKHMSELAAHQLSTVTSVLSLGAVIWLFIRFYPPSSAHHAMTIGLVWAAFTVAFEFLFFHFVGGHSWSELLANYNIFKGRVWVVVLLWVATAPYVFFHFRRRAKRVR